MMVLVHGTNEYQVKESFENRFTSNKRVPVHRLHALRGEPHRTDTVPPLVPVHSTLRGTVLGDYGDVGEVQVKAFGCCSSCGTGLEYCAAAFPDLAAQQQGVKEGPIRSVSKCLPLLTSK